MFTVNISYYAPIFKHKCIIFVNSWSIRAHNIHDPLIANESDNCSIQYAYQYDCNNCTLKNLDLFAKPTMHLFLLLGFIGVDGLKSTAVFFGSYYARTSNVKRPDSGLHGSSNSIQLIVIAVSFIIGNILSC